MRRVLVVCVAFACLAVSAACNTLGSPDASASPGATAVSSTTSLDTAGSTATVCGHIRAALASHMTTLGTVIGRYVGIRAADGDEETQDARQAVVAEIRAMAADMTRLGGAADDASLRMAASAAAGAIDAIAADPDFVRGIKQLSDVPPAVDKLGDAAQPLADACA